MAYEQPVTFTDMLIEDHVIRNQHLAVSLGDTGFESHMRGGHTTRWSTDKNLHELGIHILEHTTPDTEDYARVILPRTAAQIAADKPTRSYDIPSDQIGSIFRDVVNNQESDSWVKPTKVIARIGSATIAFSEGRIAYTDYPFNSRVVESLFAATTARHHETDLSDVLSAARLSIK